MEIAIGAAAITYGASMISRILPRMAAKAMEKVKAMVVDKVDGIVNIERDISNLQISLWIIEGIVPLAEEKQIDNVYIQNWLRDLVDIGYEARDVLDDFITFSSCTITAEEAKKPVNTISSLMLSCFCGSSSDTSNIPLSRLNKLANDIRSVKERFDEKKKEGETFATLKSVVGGGGSESVRVDRRPIVGPSTNKQEDNLFLGRDEVKEEIMEKLLRPSDNRVHVVAILGMGGIGKTTLAQSIYNDERIKEDDYPTENRGWLCVGENKFSAEKVIKEIVNDQNTTGIGNLQKKLKEKLRGVKQQIVRRFLIVLDDVWDVGGSEWDLLFNPLTEVGKGGLIIITTREREVCTATNIQKPYGLKPLSEEESWSIFESCAYTNGKSDSTPDLKGIGKEIVKKLNGHPLALKVVGRSLLNKDYSTWKNFLESNGWMLRKEDEVMSALRWSYNHLPPHLKMCFTYCSLFPKDHVLDTKVLVEMWMAHDLIQKEKQKRLEDVGAQYFEELVNASLLQCVDGKYTMHDLIYDLALLVSNGEFASTNSSLTNDQMKKARHLTITPGDYSKILSLCKIEKLFTLYTNGNQIYTTETFDYSVLDDVFKQLKSIRVLVLSHREITEIPDYISDLRHLRYLDISKTCVKRLPNSLCHLPNLQMLAVPLDVILPKDIVNLTNLRHLRANLTTYRGMAKLTSLQELSVISVSRDGNIRELGDLRELRGGIAIKGLQNVTCSQDAAQAKMQDKTHVDQVALVFSNDLRETNIIREVLDALQCPPNVTKLEIVGYNGDRSPIWMSNDANFLRYLSHLEIRSCHGLQWLKLDALVSLKYLDIAHCCNLICIASAIHFASAIEVISIASCENLERIEFERSPLVRKWTIVYCDKLISIPRLVEIEYLILDHCANLRSLNLQGRNTLGYLKLIKCEVMELIFDGGSNSSSSSSSLTLVSSPLPSLFTIWTDNKHVFTKLLKHDLISLQTLWIDGLTNVEYFSEIEDNNLCKQTSFECLAVFECKDLKSLPSNLHKLPRLKCLEITRCPELQSLPDGGLPLSLDCLTIEHCPLLFERCKDKSGLDWDKIKHISNREVCA